MRISAQPGVVVEVAGELLALLEHRAVEQLPHLAQGAVEGVPLQQLLALLGARGERGRPSPVWSRLPRRRYSRMAWSAE